MRSDVQKVLCGWYGVERVYFPEKSGQIPDRPALTLCVLHPDSTAGSPATNKLVAQMTSESGTSARTFKSALLWAVAEDGAALKEEARKLLAWKDIESDSDELKLDETQHRLLVENVKRAERDLREAVWRSYKNIYLLADDNSFRRLDLGLVHSSAATSLVELVLARLKQEDLVVDGVSPNFLSRYWPPALAAWSTKSVREAFYASPKFPRLLKAEAVRDTIARGVDAGLFAYVGKAADGRYEPFIYKRSLATNDVEISDDVFLIGHDRADEYIKGRESGVPTDAALPLSESFVPVDAPGEPAGEAAPGRPAPSPTGGVAGFSCRRAEVQGGRDTGGAERAWIARDHSNDRT